MKAEYVNPFYSATIEVFKMMLDLETSRGTNQGGNATGPWVNIAIEVTGDLRGKILYQFPQSMTLEMVKIMSGLEMDALDGFVTSALAEVSNIISGNAMSNLFKNNYQCDISTPQIVTGAPEEILGKRQVLTIPLETEIGNPLIHLDLVES